MMDKNITRSAMAAAILATLAGCAAPAYVSPVEVTRFVAPSGAFLGQGTIELVPAPGTDGDGLEYSIYADAVRIELEQLGYRVVAQNGSQVAMIGFGQSVGVPQREQGPVSVGVGGSTGSYGSGVGLGIGFDLSPRPAEQVNTIVTVAIRSGEGGTNLWEGRAGMSATTNSEFAADDAVARRLADALFADFPGNSGETVIVE